MPCLLGYILVEPTGQYMRSPAGWHRIGPTLSLPPGALYPDLRSARQAADNLYAGAAIVVAPVPLRTAH